MISQISMDYTETSDDVFLKPEDTIKSVDSEISDDYMKIMDNFTVLSREEEAKLVKKADTGSTSKKTCLF